MDNSTAHDTERVPEILSSTVRKSVVKAFEMICGNTEISKTNTAELGDHDDIIGIISFVGDITWSMFLGIKRCEAEALSLKFSGMEIEIDSPDMGDVIGELTNVLAGVVCGDLEAQKINLNMSLPTVARGNDFELFLSDKLLQEHFYFRTGDFNCWLKMVAARIK